jgi:hypothetical protein
MHRPESALLLLALFAGACDRTATELSSPAEQRMIKGGYDDVWDDGVVGIVMFGGGGLGTCTGSLISPNVVLTAQHCIAPLSGRAENGGVACGQTTFGAAYRPDRIFVTTEPTMPRSQLGYLPVDRVLVPEGSNQVCGNDVALLILKAPMDVGPGQVLVPRVDEPSAAGDQYSAIGYGATDDAGSGSGQRRRRDTLFLSCVATCGRASPTEFVGDKGVCQGDSGGPAVDLEGRVIGVASRGGSGCTFPIYGYVYAWADWIKDNTYRAALGADIEPPAWSDGWPTAPEFNGQVGETCDEAEDCPTEMCQENLCTRACNEAAPCPNGWTCLDSFGVCAQTRAAFDEQCGEDLPCAEGTCFNGRCTNVCSDANQCPDGFVCGFEEGLCIDASKGGGVPPPMFPGLGCSALGALPTLLLLLPVLALLRRRKRATAPEAQR